MLNSLPKITDPNKRSNVVVRGLPEMGRTLRPQVRIVEGRMFRPGSSEIVVGNSVARGLQVSRSANNCRSPPGTGP